MALIFEGYNQGVMGFVNGSAGYIEAVGIGSDGKVTNTTKHGDLVVCAISVLCLAVSLVGDSGTSSDEERLLSLEVSSPCSVVGCKLVRRTLI
jgi:hypothetical protein